MIFFYFVQLHFCFAHKNSHWAIIDSYTPVILQLREDKMLIYLESKENVDQIPHHFWVIFQTVYFFLIHPVQ